MLLLLLRALVDLGWDAKLAKLFQLRFGELIQFSSLRGASRVDERCMALE
jgi:hypothetical protein